MNSITANLEAILNLGGTDTSSWGSGKAKSIRNLMVEFSAEECYFRFEPTGITRVTKVVRMEILDPELGLLIEESQVLPDGQFRERGTVPSEKIIGKESPTDAVLRGMKEELRLGPESFIFRLGKREIESNDSPSYPNLPTEYQLYTFEITLAPDVRHRLKAGLKVTEEDQTQHVFIWKKE